MNKRFYWLKLKQDFFQNKEVKLMSQSAGGSTYVVIYLKMMLTSINSDGHIICDGLFGDDIAKEIAMMIDERAEDVEWTMVALERCHALERVSNHEIVLTTVSELIGSETTKAASMRRLREQRKQVTQLPDVTFCYTEKEIEKDIDLDSDIDEIVEAYRKICISLPPLKKITQSRKNSIKSALNDFTKDELKNGFKKAERSSFLKGKNRRGWQATFDWMIDSTNMDKVLDGCYDDNGTVAHTQQEYFNDGKQFLDFEYIMKDGN